MMAGEARLTVLLTIEQLAEYAHGEFASYRTSVGPHSLVRSWDELEDWERDNLVDFARIVAETAIREQAGR